MRRFIFPFIAVLLLMTIVYIPAFAGGNNHYKKETLTNGLTVIIKSNPDSKVFAVNILVKGRAYLEPKGKTGITEFVNRMLLKGTDVNNAVQLSKKLDDNGIKMTLYDNPYIPYDDIYTSRAFAFVKMETIDEYADPSLNLLAEIIGRPSFPKDKIEEVRQEIIGLLGMNSGSTYKNARNIYYKELFGDAPYSKTVLGDMKTINSITRDDLVRFHKILYDPENLIMAVATNIPVDICFNKIRTIFRDLPKSGYEYLAPPKVEPVKGIAKSHKYMKKDQVYIYLGNITAGIDNPSYPALLIATSALSTRMKLNLREKQGLAYSVGAGISLFPNFGIFTCGMGTGYKNYYKAIKGIKGEINKIRTEGITDIERENTVNSLWGSMLTRNLSRINQAYYMALFEYLGVGYRYWDKYIDNLRAVTTREVQLTAEKYIPWNNYVLATVGRK